MKTCSLFYIFRKDHLMATKNTKALIYGIFATDFLTQIDDNESLNILHEICRNIQQTRSLSYVTLENYLSSKKQSMDFDSYDGSILVYISPLVFLRILNQPVFKADRIIKGIISITHNNDETIGVVTEYLNLLYSIFHNQTTKEQILEILPELDILEDEVVVKTDAKNVFFAALWCFIMSDSYEQACIKAHELENSNHWVVEVTGALAGLYYGVESIPSEWIDFADDRVSVKDIIF